MNSAPDEFGQLRRLPRIKAEARLEEGDFSALRGLLALKRHEQPPPRYFSEFSGRVIARLETAQSAASLSWIERLMQVFELKPVLTGAFGITAFGLLLIGLVSIERPDNTAMGMNPVVSEGSIPTSKSGSDDGVNQFATPTAESGSSIDPAINSQPTSALFNGFRLNVQTIAFTPNGN